MCFQSVRAGWPVVHTVEYTVETVLGPLSQRQLRQYPVRPPRMEVSGRRRSARNYTALPEHALEAQRHLPSHSKYGKFDHCHSLTHRSRINKTESSFEEVFWRLSLSLIRWHI